MPERRSERPAESTVLTRSVARRVYWHCLTLQASWNEQRMQNLGLLAALVPWLRQQELSLNQLRDVCRRYYGYFNTNPYLAGFVVGGLLNLEAARQRGEAVSDRQVGWLRDTLAGACGALGDQLFWLGLRPALMLAAGFMALAGLWQPVLLVIVCFAAAQLVWRWRSIASGAALGPDVCREVGNPSWHRSIAWVRRAALTLTGVLCGVYFAAIGGMGETAGFVSVGIVFCLGIALPILVRQKAAAEMQLLLGLVFLCVLVLVLP